LKVLISKLTGGVTVSAYDLFFATNKQNGMLLSCGLSVANKL